VFTITWKKYAIFVVYNQADMAAGKVSEQLKDAQPKKFSRGN